MGTARPSNIWFIGSDVYRQAAYGSNHPLAIPRVGPVIDLCRIFGWLDASSYVESPRATHEDLQRFHAPDYIEAVETVDALGKSDPSLRETYGLGTMENPVFPGLFERASTSCGGSIHAAERVRAGGIAYNPAGGTHHGRSDRASGFCYFNDPVLAILKLLDQGLSRVLYVDLDAHHGDGVETAFRDDARVATLSIHERDRWPGTGTESLPDRLIWNFAVPPAFSDSELGFMMDEIVLPRATAFAPDAVVITCGADGLAGDPLSSMALSNAALWQAVDRIVRTAPRAVVVGGGGYNPWTVARCWAGLWAVLAEKAIPDTLPNAACELLEGFESDLVDEEDIDPRWLTTIADEIETGPVRSEIKELALPRAA